jgi:predicted methyltransferase
MLKTTGLSTSDVAEEVENFMFAGTVGQNVEKVGFTLDSVSKVSST